MDGRGRVQVLAKAQASVSAGCDTSILGAVATGDIDNPNVVSCTVTASGVDDNIEEDAIAYAIQEAKAYACDGLAIAKAEGAARVRPVATLAPFLVDAGALSSPCIRPHASQPPSLATAVFMAQGAMSPRRP